MEDDEHFWKSPTNCSQTLHEKKAEAITKKDILDEIFSANSSIYNSNPHFLTFKNNAEKQKLNFKSNNSEIYYQPFTPAELIEAIKTSHNTAVSPDQIHYDFLKYLPKNSLNYLLTIYNDVWISSKFPESWKRATIFTVGSKSNDKTACTAVLNQTILKKALPSQHKSVQ